MGTELLNQISLRQYQRLQLSPQLMQSITVLCMNTDELCNYIDSLYKENPCIEKKDPEISEEMMKVLSGFRGTEYRTVKGSLRSDEDGFRGMTEASVRAVDEYIDSLSFFVKDQIESKGLNKSLKAVCLYLADMLEDNGMLTTASLEAVKEIGVPEEMIREAAGVIKSLEPAGVGAEDTSEFLRLQLLRKYSEESPILNTALRIAVPEFLEALGKKDYRYIAVKTGEDIEAVRTAVSLIGSLKSSISDDFSVREETVYVRPDIYIYIDKAGNVCTAANEYALPVVNVSEKYLEVYRTTEDRELKAYLRDKLNETYRLISSIDRRESTLKRCFDYIAAVQKDFFEGSSDILRPMTMADAAEELNVHVSTVSRCVMNKYVQCPQGLLPAKYFFSRNVSAGIYGGGSAQGARIELGRLIEGEDRIRPLKDSQLCTILNQRGYEISRRTVAKYRGELGIPDYRIRKDMYGK
ncbi:MAG: RNA polymerase factor sigma-54 [Clostridiales bacterium]|nr:RNA polymerase factor sigma-54 [Clostridiales bacterium]